MTIARLISSCLVATCAIGHPVPAQAQSMSCYSRNAVVRVLQQKYGKRWLAHGTTADGTWRYEFWATPDGKKWTFFVSRARGASRLACFLAGGTDWKAVGRTWKQNQ